MPFDRFRATAIAGQVPEIGKNPFRGGHEARATKQDINACARAHTPTKTNTWKRKNPRNGSVGDEAGSV